MKSREWLAITSALLVVGMVAAMAGTGAYNLELFFSLWILWVIVAVLLLSPRDVRPRHILPLSVVMDYVERESGTGVTLLGIQPDLREPDKDLSDEDRVYLSQNLQVLFRILRHGQELREG